MKIFSQNIFFQEYQPVFILIYFFIYTRENLLLLLLKNIGNARPGEGDWLPISPKTPAPHYQRIEEKKRKGK